MCELPWICPSPSDSLLTADTARYRTKTRLDASCSEVGQHNNRQDERTSRKRYPDDMFTGPDAPQTRGRLLRNMSAVPGTLSFCRGVTIPAQLPRTFAVLTHLGQPRSETDIVSYVATGQGPLTRDCHANRHRLLRPLIAHCQPRAYPIFPRRRPFVPAAFSPSKDR